MENLVMLREAEAIASSELPPLESTYRNTRVFVTGHTGFKGSWLCAWLCRLGAKVTGYALPPPTQPSLFDTLKLSAEMHNIHGDIRDLESLYKAMKDARPEIVLHLAAQPLVLESYKNPKVTFDTNVGGTVNMFEALRRYRQARVFINVTSDKCYDNREWLWSYRENDAMGGRDPYSASKGCAELVFNAYARSYFDPAEIASHGLALASVRAGNVIGGGDWAENRIVPDCVRALSSGRIPGLRNPRAVRPWQHVLEPLGGYLRLAQQLLHRPDELFGGWNFGPQASNCRTVAQLAQAFVKVWGSGHWEDLSENQTNAVHEARFLRLCCDRANHVLKWNPVWDFEQTVRHTADWYRVFYEDPLVARDFCHHQIEEYSEAMAQCPRYEQAPSGAVANVQYIRNLEHRKEA